MLSIIIDPSKLGGADTWKQETAAFVDWVKKSPPGAAGTPVMVAGEPERKSKAKREADGIPVDATTWSEIIAAGESVKVAAAETNAAAGLS